MRTLSGSSSMRASPRRFVKTLFIVSLCGFVLINLNLFFDGGGAGSAGNNAEGDLFSAAENEHPRAPPEGSMWNRINFVPGGINTGNTSNSRGVMANYEHPKGTDISKHLPSHINNRTRGGENESHNASLVFNSDRYQPIGSDPAAMKAYIAYVNRAQRIRNLDRFDLPTSENSAVIVVQVHDRTEYLRILLESFRKARYIENALLIFSHDYFSDEVNKLIEEIDFCLVMQVFYPIPIQLYPHEFPGEDPGDCPRDFNREQAARAGCINSQWPDKYGHYREAKYTQTKHHWFWKANHVFDRLKVMKNFNGPVLFVEEDHMMTEDFIHVLQKMYRFRDQACKDCSILTLGTYLKQPVYGSYAKKGFWEILFGYNDEVEPKYDGVDVMNWVSSKHNMGMAFNRQVWNNIKACSEAFCRFDDYNWDWSLQYVSMSCMQSKLRVMFMKSPRIYHIGECGVHHKGKNCDSASRVYAIKKLLSDNHQFLYPDQLEIAGYPRAPTKMPKPNGGWGDRRDHELCIRFTQPELHS